MLFSSLKSNLFPEILACTEQPNLPEPRPQQPSSLRLPAPRRTRRKLKSPWWSKCRALREGPWPIANIHPRRALAVLERRALSDLDDVAIRIADIAANLAVLGNRRREELRSPAFPQFVARLNICNAEVHKAVDVIRVGHAERYRRLVRGGPAPDIQNHPDIRELQVGRRVAVTHGQYAGAEDLFVVASRSLDIGDGQKVCDADPFPRGHLIALLFDLYRVHQWLLPIQSSLQILCPKPRSHSRKSIDAG